MNNPLLELSELELRDFCRHHVDSFENWSRRLIDESLRNAYGDDYFNFTLPQGVPIVKNEIKKEFMRE